MGTSNRREESPLRALVRATIARKVAQPKPSPPPYDRHSTSRGGIHHCEACGQPITWADIKAYRVEAGDDGFPATCEDCAEIAAVLPGDTIVGPGTNH